jgi:hypothetical protein
MDEERARTGLRRDLRLGIVGDAMLGVGAAGQSAAPLDGAGLWAPVDGCDAVLVNLENPITARRAPRVAKKYLYRMDPSLLPLLDRRWLVGLANNHLLDYGEDALRDTLAALEQRGVPHCGAGRDLDEARRPLVLERCGMRIALVCAADPRYESAGAGAPGTCPATPALLRETLAALRGSVDHVVVSLHLGMEFVPYPTQLMRSLAALCLDEGAGVVVFHHAHVLGGHAADPRGVILWGTGNYVFPPEDLGDFPAWFETAAWIVRLPAGGGAPRLERMLPLMLDARGRPAAAGARDAERIRRSVGLLSSRSRSPWRTAGHRLLHLLRPRYLKTAGANYVHMARRDGWVAVARNVASAVRAHAGRGRKEGR